MRDCVARTSATWITEEASNWRRGAAFFGRVLAVRVAGEEHANELHARM